jgi:hypothetical protein
MIVGPLGVVLVLDVNAGDASGFHLTDRPRHVHGLAEPGAAVDLERDVHRLGDQAGAVDRLGHRQRRLGDAELGAEIPAPSAIILKPRLSAMRALRGP